MQNLNFDSFCALIGGLWLLDLLAYSPIFSVFFGKIEARGYRGLNRRWVLGLQLAWGASALALIWGGQFTRLLATVFFYALFRHFYIDSRWSSVRRGGGAPGFMSHWAAFYLLILQLSALLDSGGGLSEKVCWMMQVDFAVIMICAGTYKYMVGYMHHDGMEYGRVNPLWGYLWEFHRNQNPTGLYVRFTNFMAFAVEIAAGILMLIPGYQWLGAIAISLSFFYVALEIRLGRLAILMSVLPMIYATGFHASLMAQSPVHLPTPTWLLGYLSWLPVAFVALLPLVKCQQYLNLFSNRTLPQPLQGWLSTYANQVPIIMWRVFTPDVTNFYVRIYEEEPATGRSFPICDERTLNWRSWGNLWLKLRFWHVTEAIALVSVFTTLKYFPSNRKLFDQKLLTYSRSLEYALGRPVEHLRYEYVVIRKGKERFLFDHVGNFFVDLGRAQVREEKLEDFDFAAPSRYSPVRESVAPGSFTPVAR